MERPLAWGSACLAAAALCACVPMAPGGSARAPAQSLPRYGCDNGTGFAVSFADDTAAVDAGAGGRELLLRDAGGLTPQQTVYSNPRLRAEFGLGAGGDEALLHYLSLRLEVRCRRAAGR